MDSLIVINAILVGLFSFAAVHYAVAWWFSRDERVLLLFSIQCGVYAVFCVSMFSLLRATTISDAQTWMDRCVTIGVLAHAVVVNFYARLVGRRDLAFVGTVTGVLIFLAVLNLWAPLRGTVIELHVAQLPGGGTALVPIRTPPGASLALLYITLFAASGYGLFVAGVTWMRDRAGAIPVIAGMLASLFGIVSAVLVDFAGVRVPFPGAIPHAVFVACMAFYLSREYAARGVRLAASERRAENALRESEQALAELGEEHKLLEESESARLRAMEALAQAQRKELASQLAAGVAHDFSNLLSVISVWSDFLLDGDLPPDRIEKARNALEDAQEQGHALSKQLMTLARTENRVVKRIPFERPIRMAAKTLAAALPRNIDFTSYTSEAVEVEVDENEIQQVLYNLVLNARDAMPDGGTIHVNGGVETVSDPIDVVNASIGPGRWATLSVKDSGPGIDPTIRERIFDLYFTTKGEKGGTGLGLATVLRIAKANGGGVTLEDSGESGSTFKLYFPVHESAASGPLVENFPFGERPEEQPASFQASSV